MDQYNAPTKIGAGLLLALALVATAQAQTASDACGYNPGNKYPVNISCSFTDFDKPGAFVANYSPATCTAGNYDDAYGWFTATSNTTIITYDPDNSHRAIMHVFTGACGSLTQVACVNAGSDGTNADLIVQTVVGTDYMIRIQRHNTNNPMDGRLCIWSPTTTNWCGFPAISQIPVSANCTPQPFVKPDAYTATYTATGCGAGNFDDAFGWFTATSTSTLINYDPDNNQRPILHVYSGTCGSLTQVGCIDAGVNGNNATLTLATTVGANYLIRIQLRGADTEMNGTICITAPITNNECAGATDLFIAESCFMQYYHNVGSTASGTLPAPVCGGTPNTDVWFRFVAPSSGAVRIFSEAGTLSDAAFQLYSGTCGALSLVADGCDNDGGTGANNLMPYLDRRCSNLTGGATYYLRFWGYSGSVGNFGLCVYGPDIFPTPVQDCVGGYTICGSGAISNTSDYIGCTADLNNTNRGCLASNERQGTWYYFSPRSAGNIEFTINPINAAGAPVNVDYDFAIWGPLNTPSCTPIGNPLRCSYANPVTAGTYQTGLRSSEVDVSENAGGNGFVAPITVALADVGKVYVMYIDNFTSNGQSFNLNWTLAAANQLDCSVLPISIIELTATALSRSIRLHWVAQDAASTDRFLIERSADGLTFEAIGTMTSERSGNGTTDHLWDDNAPMEGINFYRITALSVDGTVERTEVVSALYHPKERSLIAVPNPARTALRFHLESSDLDEELNVLVTDASGRVVHSALYRPNANAPVIDMNVSQLAEGYYMVKLTNSFGERIGSGRFVKE